MGRKKDKKKFNIALADIQVYSNWEFAEGLRKATGEEWLVECWDNAGLMKNKISNIERILGYIIHSFQIFRKRKIYNSIVAWQQFYGLIFAVYCVALKKPKVNDLTVMTFIFKEKKGLLGRLYKKVVGTAVRSNYIDRIVVYSKSEAAYYAELFKVNQEKFQYLPLGIEEKKELGEPSKALPEEFLLSVGRSNRDYGFLLRCSMNIHYKIVILTDGIGKNETLPSNVILYNDVRGEEYLRILQKSKAVLIPLEDKNISSGQLVMLQAMQYRKPIIITESFTIGDYVKNGINAIVCKKEEKEFIDAINLLMNDTELQDRLIDNGYRIYKEKYSLRALGENLGKVLSGENVNN